NIEMRFVDSNVFIYHIAADPQYGGRARKILGRIEEGEEAATSTLVITQVCSYLRWKKRQETIPSFLSLLRGLTSLQKLDTRILDFEEARETHSKLKLPWSMWDDIVISEQMKRLDTQEVYSNDRDFDEIPGIERIF
ncbi:MAG: type II toxin-antitoxin system VapC family toxin, partial [Candidatus Geothermarchaeales archaeon]